MSLAVDSLTGQTLPSHPTHPTHRPSALAAVTTTDTPTDITADTTTGTTTGTQSHPIALLLSLPVDIEQDAAAFHVNHFPFSVAQQAPMEHVYVLFEMVRAPAIFVVHDGGLRGMISRERLLDSLRGQDGIDL